MVFYLLSEGLTAFGFVSGAYKSLKILHSREKQKSLETTLKFWTVMACATLFEQYLELFLFWFPFYYMLKSIGLLMIVFPGSTIPNVAFEAFVIPVVNYQRRFFDRKILPKFQHYAIRYGSWLNDAIVGYSIGSMNTHELEDFEKSLRGKLTQIQIELKSRSDERIAEED